MKSKFRIRAYIKAKPYYYSDRDSVRVRLNKLSMQHLIRPKIKIRGAKNKNAVKNIGAWKLLLNSNYGSDAFKQPSQAVSYDHCYIQPIRKGEEHHG